MRPHRMRVTAFGPFADTVEIDVDTLATSGLFLLQGETGAGKTTLLDAMGFALYGSVPGERGRARRLRSDHAAAAKRTEVQLEVSIAGRRLRITRSPEQVRPKQRGSGVTTEPARMLLEEAVGDGWAVLSTRIDEASNEITELMGMSAEQFFQVVLLPQNDFARFLRAGSKDRGELLQRLFGTDRFRRAEEWLAEGRRTGLAALDKAQGRVEVLAARFAQAAGIEQPADRPNPTEVTDRVAASRRAAAATAADVVASQDLASSAAKRAASARDVRDRQQRRAGALARKAVLDADAARVAALATEWDRASRAVAVAPYLAEADHREAALQDARRCQRATLQAVVTIGLDAAAGREGRDQHAAHPGVLPAALERAASRLIRLDSLRAVAETETTERSLAARCDAEGAALGARIASCAASLAALPERRRKRAAAVAEARDAVSALPAAGALETALRAARSDAAALAEASVEVDALGVEHLGARTHALDVRQHALSLRERRVDGMIAELAAALEDGTPCPVCGSLRHPEPSDVRGGRVSRDDEEAAFAAAEAAAALAAEIDARRAGYLATTGMLAGRLADGGVGSDPSELGAALAAAAAHRAALATVAARTADAEAALTGLEEERSALDSERVSLTEQQRATARRAADARGRAEAAGRELRGELAGVASLDAAIVATRRALETLQAAATAGEAAGRAAAEHRRAAAAVALAATEAGFTDVESLRTASREEPWRVDAADRLEQRRTERATVAEALADPALAVSLDVPTDVDGAELAAFAAQEALGAAQGRQSVVAQQAAALDKLAPPLLRAITDLDHLAARVTELRELADLVGGGGANVLRMTLTSFVLAARLEEVAAAASERLLAMTQGRYRLVHTDEGRGGGRLGLGLLARDSWTGQDRDTSTLSGGETFLASLALALGLAEVVTAEAGGAPIEALFIDEGFGTLDEETLDEVMDVLDGLREGGRVVGVVSHVAELRQRIPSQVRIRKGRSGSDLTVVGC